MTIEIPRKRRKQIKKLKGKTASLLGEQRKVLEHANAILAEARSHAADAARKDIAPRVQNAIDNGKRIPFIQNVPWCGVPNRKAMPPLRCSDRRPLRPRTHWA